MGDGVDVICMLGGSDIIGDSAVNDVLKGGAGVGTCANGELEEGCGV